VPVVVDTGPLLSAINRKDEAHRLAAMLIDMSGRDLIIPDPVVVEVDHLARQQVGHKQARLFLAALAAGTYTRGVLTPSLFAEAVAIDRAYADLHLGLTDASVMAFAASTGHPILTFDFTDFRAAPPRSGGAWPLVIDEARFSLSVRSTR
jgi:predicted nucleic acid-binding protein